MACTAGAAASCRDRLYVRAPHYRRPAWSAARGAYALTSSGYCPTRLLPDKPAAADTLGGAHDRVASAIADLVQSEGGGNAIGLEGGWGAGKSTIVRLVTGKLMDDSTGSTRVAVFDAWAHQGDPCAAHSSSS